MLVSRRPPPLEVFDSEQMYSYDGRMAVKKLFLIHWNEVEVKEYAEGLRVQGWKVDIEHEDGARAAKVIKENTPDLVVIYHTRLPSHGRATAAYLAETKATSEIPLLIVGGEGEALGKTKTKLPDATYTSHEDLIAALSTLLEDK